MQIDRPAFGGGTSVSTLHPIMLVATILAIILIFALPRKRVVAPFLLVIFLGSFGQQVYVAGVHLYVLRILILAGLLRVFAGGRTENESRFAGGWTGVDTVYTVWVLCHAIAAILQFGGAGGAIIYQGGFIWDAFGAYILLRIAIRDEEDITFTIKVFAAITLCLGLGMINEKLRSQNIFGYLGILPIVPEVREGAIRAKSAFAHSILAGVFAATLVPLFWWLWQSGKAKKIGVLGFLGSTAMVIASASSTPLLAYLATLVGLGFWPMRKSMRLFRWAVASMLIALHLVMKAPVWFLIARVDLIAGNSGYHRAMLIDQCVRHFREWWLIGAKTADWGWDMWDLSNQFVAEADTGGLLTFIFFLLVIQRCFNRIGRARKIVEGNSNQEWFMWLLGIGLFAHVVSYFGVNYYDHTKILWCAFLAILIAATAPVLATQEAESPLPRASLAFHSPSIAQRVPRDVSR